MVCGYARWLSAVLSPTRKTEDLFAGWRCGCTGRPWGISAIP